MVLVVLGNRMKQMKYCNKMGMKIFDQHIIVTSSWRYRSRIVLSSLTPQQKCKGQENQVTSSSDFRGTNNLRPRVKVLLPTFGRTKSTCPISKIWGNLPVGTIANHWLQSEPNSIGATSCRIHCSMGQTINNAFDSCPHYLVA